FLNEVYRTLTELRSPSPPPTIDFFYQGNGRLLSPPPSSPEPLARNVYAVDEKDVHIWRTTTKNLRQTRLDEFKSGFLPTKNITEDSGSRSLDKILSDSLGNATTIQSIMGCTSQVEAIDWTQGVVSSRQPRQI